MVQASKYPTYIAYIIHQLTHYLPTCMLHMLLYCTKLIMSQMKKQKMWT